MTNVRDSNTPQDSRDQRYRNWDAYEEESDEPEPFKDLIQRDPTVCDNCFLRRYETVNVEWWRGSFGWSEYSRWTPIPERSEKVPADSVTKGTRLACANCGHRNAKSRPVSKDNIEDYTANISTTLDAKQIEHDCSVLFSEVRDRNTSDNQGKQDTHVFAPAVRLAIEAVKG